LEIPANISKYYPSEYYSFSQNQLTRSSSKPAKSRFEEFLEKRRNTYALFDRGIIGKLLNWRFPPDEKLRSLSRVALTEESKILDVGCGSGSLLYSLKQIGFKNLLGIDKFIKEDMVYTNGLRIQKGELQNITGKWDLVMFNHSFEHMSDQLATLQTASKLLTRVGVCLINMPTVSSYAWKIYNTNWVQLDAPRHYFLHSVSSLRLLAEKAGLILKEVFYNSTAFQFWGSEQYLKGIPLRSARSYTENPSNSIFTASQIRRFEQKAKELNLKNQGDMAAFYLVSKYEHYSSIHNQH
jgi:SAM-dependent methyltransferase